MNVEYINSFIEASQIVLKSVANTDILIGKVYLKTSQYASDTLVMFIGLMGDIRGQVIISMNKTKQRGFCMSFAGASVKEKSYDPYYKVEFTYECDEIRIEKGYAEIVRKQPKLEITYDTLTEEKLKAVDNTKLELELVNLVLSHFISGKNMKSLIPKQHTLKIK